MPYEEGDMRIIATTSKDFWGVWWVKLMIEGREFRDILIGLDLEGGEVIAIEVAKRLNTESK